MSQGCKDQSTKMQCMNRKLNILIFITMQYIGLAIVWLQYTKAFESPLQTVMNAIALKWDFYDGRNGWGNAATLEMGIEIEAKNGKLYGIVPSSGSVLNAYVESPELNVYIDPAERDYLVFSLQYHGQCHTAMISLYRKELDHNDADISDNIVEIPFQLKELSLHSELYYIPIWQHFIGSIHRVRLHPCIKTSNAMKGQQFSGQTFHIDWIAFTKAPIVTNVRGCLDEYFYPNDTKPHTNCETKEAFINKFLKTSQLECKPLTGMLSASTFNCLRDGGTRLTISGKYFGSSDAIVLVDSQECTDIVHTKPETELECTLPPTTTDWLKFPRYPSIVSVINGRLHGLRADEPRLSYAGNINARPAPKISNLASHSMDVSWTSHAYYREFMSVTGYKIIWQKCQNPASMKYFVVGNITTTTIIHLEKRTKYEVQIRPIVEDQARLYSDLKFGMDLYGRRNMLENSVIGEASPWSKCVETLSTDFQFDRFNARLLTNQTIAVRSKIATTVGPTGEIGNQGHYGLYINGDAELQNCNEAESCCDNYTISNISTCTYACTVREPSLSYILNGKSNRSISTNSITSGIPSPGKLIYNFTQSQSARYPVPTSACGPALTLTPGRPRQIGSAWYPRQMNVHEGFITQFQFNISDYSTHCKTMHDVNTYCKSRGGDGFAFVIQNDHEIALGNGGMALGYGGLKQALAIEFDTWYNYELEDPYENHISVHISDLALGGDSIHARHTQSLGSTSNIPDLAEGNHTIQIIYNPQVHDGNIFFTPNFKASTFAGLFMSSRVWNTGLGELKIYIDNMNLPVLVVPLRIDRSIELHHGRAWVGFTAATGELAYQRHDILEWKFSSLRQDIYMQS